MSLAARKQESDLSNETDADLLTMISWQATDDQVARAAWGEFYDRHFKFLGAVCLRAYVECIGNSGVEDLVNDTFLRVFTHGAETFVTKEKTPENIRKQVRTWLRTIAHRIFLMNLRARQDISEKLFADFETSFPKQVSLSEERKAQCERVRAVIETLTPREIDILFARFWNYDGTAKKQTFDPEILADLQEKWKTTDVNIRQILSRTLAKIKESLS